MNGSFGTFFESGVDSFYQRNKAKKKYIKNLYMHSPKVN